MSKGQAESGQSVLAVFAGVGTTIAGTGRRCWAS
jgi:hypothetical protein